MTLDICHIYPIYVSYTFHTIYSFLPQQEEYVCIYVCVFMYLCENIGLLISVFKQMT